MLLFSLLYIIYYNVIFSLLLQFTILSVQKLFYFGDTGQFFHRLNFFSLATLYNDSWKPDGANSSEYMYRVRPILFFHYFFLNHRTDMHRIVPMRNA